MYTTLREMDGFASIYLIIEGYFKATDIRSGITQTSFKDIRIGN